MIRVLVADDQDLVREGFAALVDAQPDLEVVGRAADGAAAVDLARTTRPDVVVMDVRMPILDGIAATGQICADPDLAGTRVLVLTTFETDETVLAALRAGASGFLGKGSRTSALLDAVRVVASGEELLSAAATRALIARVVDAPATPVAPSPELGGLTDREREMVVLVARGLSNEEIAAAEVLSPLTVKTHVNRAMAKLGARDRAQLVVMAYQAGLAGR
ncbi:response regulator transcription factor [Sanguibacter sp. HDW7]|uniref:response regulator transcription factor n=1 Tax=Sanguibacter sp. HDW7 TaxID=2714931 RepID=UPI001408179C|nr:response regulator transcription factor [Sanguibacter sp. HDW7]QIK83785.1 response regulator transcription factor [Sanguibacter sp. HDW7]